MKSEDRNIARFMRITTSMEICHREDVFEYSPNMGWVGLQKVCFFLLKKIGAFYQERITVFTRTPQQNDDLLKTLTGQHGQWIELIHHRQANRIIMGPDECQDLMSIAHGLGMQLFQLDARIETKDGSRDFGTWHNIPITIVPWMKGAVLIPDFPK